MFEDKNAVQLLTAAISLCSLLFLVYQTVTERRQRRISAVYDMFKDDDFGRHIDRARALANSHGVDIGCPISEAQAKALYEDVSANAAIQSYLTYLENIASAVKVGYADYRLMCRLNGNYFKSAFANLKPFIDVDRTRMSDAFVELEWFAKRCSK